MEEIKRLYFVRDSLAERVLAMLMFRSDVLAVRNFDSIKRSAEFATIGRDLALWYVGEIDITSGTIVLADPMMMVAPDSLSGVAVPNA